MMITRQKRVPWSWVVLSHYPWAGMLFASAVVTIIFALEMRKFTADPAIIGVVLTVTGVVSLIFEPLVNFLSDRVWTRFGRRKLFYVPSIFGQIVVICCIPFAPNMTVLLGLMTLHLTLISLGKPKESLVNEVVPNHQRGRGSVVHSVFVNVGLAADELGADEGNADAKRLGRLIEAAGEVAAGFRNHLARPLPEAGYEPKRADYFSTYVFMAATDLVGLCIVFWIIRLERRGKIQRLGAMEDEYSVTSEGKA